MNDRQLRVSLRWGDRLIDVRHFGEGAAVTAGAFGVERAGSGTVLARLQGGEARLYPPEGASVGMRAGLRPLPAEALWQRAEDGSLVLTEGASAEILLGHLAFDFRCAPAPERVVAELPNEAEVRFAKLAAFGFLGFAALLAAIRLTPVIEDEGPGFFKATAEAIRYVSVARHHSPLKQFTSVPVSPDRARPAGEEGRFGRPDPSRRQSPIVRSREANALIVRSAGIFEALGELSPAAKAVLEGGGLGAAVNDALGGVKPGAGPGDSRGFGGWSSRGSGPGGGGRDLALGYAGNLLDGSCSGPRGAPAVGLRGRAEVEPPSGPTHLSPGLPRDVILKVVKRHQSEIKYCYESQLNQARELAGKVSVLFVIDPAGGIAEAAVAETSLGSDPVEACMVAAIRRWRFPEPAGGGTVTVTFPWVFKVAGQDDAE